MKKSCAKLLTAVGTFPVNTLSLSCYCASTSATATATITRSKSRDHHHDRSHWISNSNMVHVSPVWKRSSSSSIKVLPLSPSSSSFLRRNYSSDSADRNKITSLNASVEARSDVENTHRLNFSSMPEPEPVLTENQSHCSIGSPSTSTICAREYEETSSTTTTTAKKAKATSPFTLSRSFTPIRTVVTSQVLVEVSREPSIMEMEQPKLLSKEEREEFMSMYHTLVKELLEIPDMKDMEETNRWMARVLQYNVPHGKRNRGLSTVLAYKYLAPEELTEENVRLAYVLGWCVEILQAYFLVSDDIMDGSETRRGRPCWYKVDNLGLSAINDALLLETCIYKILQKHFGGKACYARLMEIMHDVTYKTIFGQSLDTRTGQERRMETYTMERYSSIVKYKTSYYSFYLPVALVMAMCDIKDPKIIQQVRKVTLEMGHFFQVQDDYLDCFGDVEVTGKIGTDIQDCKCSWLFVIAMQRCDPDQKKFLLDNYGKHEADKVEAVKEFYKKLELEDVYRNYEEQTYNMICTHIQQMNDELPKGLFYDILHKIYKRSS